MNLQDASGQDIFGLDAVRRVRAASKVARLSAKVDLESERGDDGALVASPAGSVSFHQRSAAIQQASFVTQLKKTLNAIPAFTWYKLPSGALAFVNERSGDYLGLAKDHPLRFGVDTDAAFDSHIFIIHPDDRDVARQSWEDCLRTQAAVEASFRIRNSEGEYRWFLVRAEPLRSDDGTLLYWVGISLDIEARKRAELYLTEGQRLARAGSWAFNSAGFEYWSPQLFEIHGLDAGGKAPGITEYMSLVHPEDRDFVAREIRRVLAEECGFDFTKRIVRPDGAIRHVRCVGIPSPTGQGLMGTGIDVTEQVQLTRLLRKSEEEFQAVQDWLQTEPEPMADGALGTSEPISFGPFCVHRARRLIERNGETVPLGSRAFDILICLLEHAGQVVEKAELFRRVWPNSIVEEGNLRFHINALRKALGEGRYVANIAGRGYSFVAPVSRLSAERPLGMRSTSVRPFIDFTDITLRR